MSIYGPEHEEAEYKELCRGNEQLEKDLERAELEIARLNAEVLSLSAYMRMAEEAKQILRDLGMGVTGTDILETAKITADYLRKMDS